MGMFDTIVTPCPEPNCGGMLELQTKAGPCLLNIYHLEDLPQRILIAEEGETMRCDVCGNTRILRVGREARMSASLE